MSLSVRRAVLTVCRDLPIPLEVDLVPDEDHSVVGHVIALRQVHQNVLGHLKAELVHHGVNHHVDVRVVRRAECLHLASKFASIRTLCVD